MGLIFLLNWIRTFAAVNVLIVSLYSIVMIGALLCARVGGDISVFDL